MKNKNKNKKGDIHLYESILTTYFGANTKICGQDQLSNKFVTMIGFKV